MVSLNAILVTFTPNIEARKEDIDCTIIAAVVIFSYKGNEVRDSN